MPVLHEDRMDVAVASGSTVFALIEKYSSMLKKHRIPQQHWEKLVLFVEECLSDHDPFIEEVDRNEQLQRFVEDVLMHENKFLGDALKELLNDEQESLRAALREEAVKG